jgi:hypothetical protein
VDTPWEGREGHRGRGRRIRDRVGVFAVSVDGFLIAFVLPAEGFPARGTHGGSRWIFASRRVSDVRDRSRRDAARLRDGSGRPGHDVDRIDDQKPRAAVEIPADRRVDRCEIPQSGGARHASVCVAPIAAPARSAWNSSKAAAGSGSSVSRGVPAGSCHPRRRVVNVRSTRSTDARRHAERPDRNPTTGSEKGSAMSVGPVARV